MQQAHWPTVQLIATFHAWLPCRGLPNRSHRIAVEPRQSEASRGGGTRTSTLLSCPGSSH